MIRLISDKLRQNGCTVVQASGDADVDIVEAAVSSSMTKSTTLIGEDTDLLVLLLFKELYFRSDTSKDTTVYDINVLSNVLGVMFQNISYLPMPLQGAILRLAYTVWERSL